MAPRVHELRLSFLWFETLPKPAPDAAPNPHFAFVGNRPAFEAAFEKIKSDTLDFQKTWWAQNVPPPYDPAKFLTYQKQFDAALEQALANPNQLTLPWPWRSPRYKHNFWENYNENKALDSMRGADAWRLRVPLRVTIPATIRAPFAQSALLVDVFLYPHGIGIALHCRLRPKQKMGDEHAPNQLMSFSLKQLIARAFDARTNGAYTLEWKNGATETLKLNPLTTQLFQYVRDLTLGANAMPGTREVKPFTVATVIRASGVDETSALDPEGEIHRALYGLANWRETWESDAGLENPENANLLQEPHPLGNYLYRASRGRVVWFPTHFSAKNKRNHKLGCYHRNLTLLTMQTEALLQAVKLVDDTLNMGQTPSAVLNDLAYPAALLLGRLYGGKGTYKSISAKAHIESDNMRAVVERVRAHLNIKPAELFA